MDPKRIICGDLAFDFLYSIYYVVNSTPMISISHSVNLLLIKEVKLRAKRDDEDKHYYSSREIKYCTSQDQRSVRTVLNWPWFIIKTYCLPIVPIVILQLKIDIYIVEMLTRKWSMLTRNSVLTIHRNFLNSYVMWLRHRLCRLETSELFDEGSGVVKFKIIS